jgi:peptide/nickel transport system substrate-binding protein/oligopeptide transport system substrate-binding protein
VAIEQIRLQFSDDITTISHDFNRNAVDWVMGGNFDGSQVVENDAIKVAAQFGTKYYFFASNEPLFKQEALRLALIEAISSDKLRQNEAVEAQSLIPTLPHYPAVKAIKNNLSRAQRTLDELGYSDRSLLPPLTIASYSLNDSVALLIKTSWENLGFVVSLVSPSEEEDYFDFIRDNRPTLAVMLWNGDFLDPTAFLNMWRSDSPFNFSQFNSSVFDSFLDAANYSSGNERLKMLSDAESLLIKGGYLVAVGHLLSYNLINTNVIEGWYDNPLDIHYFKYLSFRKNKALAGGIEAAL